MVVIMIGPETQQTGLINCLLRRFAFPALGLQSEIHHHDAVFLDDADQQDNPNKSNDAEFGAADEQCQDSPDSGGRQGGDDGDGVNIAFVENPQNDVNGN